MTKTFLFLDMDNLAWRAIFSTGGMNYQDENTGILYGILRDLQTFQDRFGSFSTVCCFDYGKSLREKKCPWYKETRRKKKLTDDEQEQYQSLCDQRNRLRKDILPRMGYSNILFQDGYEADDIIASAVHALPEGDEGVIISGDGDMYQLISDSVSVYHPTPQKLVTRKSFRKQWGLGPSYWPKIKAVAGCKTDDVHGVDGVGELTAAKFFRGELRGKPKGEKIRQFIWSKDYQTNLELVTLPYPGTKEFKLVPDDLDLEAKQEIYSEFGLRSLR